MIKHLRRVRLFWFFFGLALCCPVLAAVSSGSPRMLGGDFGGYLQAKLPNPLVLYVLGPHGSLIGYAVAHRSDGDVPLEKMKRAIHAQNFRDFNVRKSSETGKALAGYLATQGYKADDVADNEAKYSLLLVVADAKADSCAGLRQFQRRYEIAIQGAVDQPPVGGSYRLTTLVLHANVPLTCRN